jgi:hypothetical protein
VRAGLEARRDLGDVVATTDQPSCGKRRIRREQLAAGPSSPIACPRHSG